jgi:TRAP-type mannitol/chloroaromatic compound transport system permease small subunit
MDRIIAGLNWVNRAVGLTVCWLALAMVLLQFAIVILRYLFGISYIFLQEGVLYMHAGLFMLGAGYALLVDEHVRVDIFYSRLGPRGRAMIDVFGGLVLLLPSMLVLLWVTWPFVRRSWIFLEGPISVGGIPASFLLKSLITAFCVLLIIQGISLIPVQCAAAVGGRTRGAGGMIARCSSNISTSSCSSCCARRSCSGFPVVFTLTGVAVLFAGLGWLLGVFDLPLLGALGQRIFGIMTSNVLIAIPLFIFMGIVLERSRIAEDLLETMGRLFGTLRGGLAISVVVVGALLAASTGIVGATVVTMGLIALPSMLRHGYDHKLASGTVVTAGTLGQIIPPSTMLIILSEVMSTSFQQAQFRQGLFTIQTISVGEIFAAALMPGLMLVAFTSSMS